MKSMLTSFRFAFLLLVLVLVLARSSFAQETVQGLAVDQQGHVGIGTLSPQYNLDVNGTAHATSFVGDGAQLTGIPNPYALSKQGNSSSQAVYVDSAGKVGVGTTTPSQQLNVYSAGQANSQILIQPGSWATGSAATIAFGDQNHTIAGKFASGTFFTDMNAFTFQSSSSSNTGAQVFMHGTLHANSTISTGGDLDVTGAATAGNLKISNGGLCVGNSSCTLPSAGRLTVQGTTQVGSLTVPNGGLCVGTSTCTPPAAGGISFKKYYKNYSVGVASSGLTETLVMGSWDLCVLSSVSIAGEDDDASDIGTCTLSGPSDGQSTTGQIAWSLVATTAGRTNAATCKAICMSFTGAKTGA